MTCSHISIHRATLGQTSTCSNCKADIIHDGKKWRWVHDVDPRRRAEWKKLYILARVKEQADVS